MTDKQMIDVVCKNCRFYVPVLETVNSAPAEGQCRFKPPVYGESSRWVFVTGGDFCGEFRPSPLNGIKEDQRTIINHEKEIDDLKSQLSNRDKENKELKADNKKLIQSIENFMNKGEGYCPECLERISKSKGEEE